MTKECLNDPMTNCARTTHSRLLGVPASAGPAFASPCCAESGNTLKRGHQTRLGRNRAFGSFFRGCLSKSESVANPALGLHLETRERAHWNQCYWNPQREAGIKAFFELPDQVRRIGAIGPGLDLHAQFEQRLG